MSMESLGCSSTLMKAMDVSDGGDGGGPSFPSSTAGLMEEMNMASFLNDTGGYSACISDSDMFSFTFCACDHSDLCMAEDDPKFPFLLPALASTSSSHQIYATAATAFLVVVTISLFTAFD